MNIDHLREHIDKIDQCIVSLLNARAAAARDISLLKAAAGLPVRDSVREGQVLRSVTARSKGAMDPAGMSRIYERILAESRAAQEQAIDELRLAGVLR